MREQKKADLTELGKQKKGELADELGRIGQNGADIDLWELTDRERAYVMAHARSLGVASDFQISARNCRKNSCQTRASVL